MQAAISNFSTFIRIFYKKFYYDKVEYKILAYMFVIVLYKLFVSIPSYLPTKKKYLFFIILLNAYIII